MKILMLAINDPAGSAINLCRAINQHSAHSCRLVTLEIRYNFMFPKDFHLPWLDTKDLKELESLLKECDIFHFHMTADENLTLGPFQVKDYLHNKVLVHHHHGHPDFRGNPQKYIIKYKELKRTKLLVSTPDLLKLLPGSFWLPNVVPLEEKLYTPLPDKPEIPVTICHSPTRRELKNTDLFIKSLNNLKSSFNSRLQVRLIEHTLHRRCLALKRSSHILFDHLQGYFGMSSLEGLAQGLAVVAGLDDWNQDQIREFTGCTELPWVLANPDNLEQVFDRLIQDKEEQRIRGERARQFMERCWREEQVVQRLIAFYEQC